MTDSRVHGHTETGRPITGEAIDRLAAEAEAGYDVDTLRQRRGKRGRRSLGSAPATVESVRLDPELRVELAARDLWHGNQIAGPDPEVIACR
ncbi:MAG: CopG family transcriptional regulator [Solirubrobacteraceae bacterium]